MGGLINMAYVLFNEENGLVIKISNEEIKSYRGYLVAQTEMYVAGDESVYNLHVHEVINDLVTQIGCTRNAPEFVPVLQIYYTQLIKTLELEEKLESFEEQKTRLDVIDEAIVAIGAEVWKEV